MCAAAYVTAISRGGSAGIRNLYLDVTSSGDIRNDNRSYVVIAQRKSRVRGRFLVSRSQTLAIECGYARVEYGCQFLCERKSGNQLHKGRYHVRRVAGPSSGSS